jgi:hypothetical protein
VPPQKAKMLGAWSPTGGATLESSGNFGRWDLAGERSLGLASGGILFLALLFLSLYLLCFMR